MAEECYELKVKGKLENLPAIIDFIIGSLRKLGADDESAFDAQLAVDEIATNIIKYAYKDRAGDIRTTCRKDGQVIDITLSDEGPAFESGEKSGLLFPQRS